MMGKQLAGAPSRGKQLAVAKPDDSTTIGYCAAYSVCVLLALFTNELLLSLSMQQTNAAGVKNYLTTTPFCNERMNSVLVTKCVDQIAK